MTPHLNYLVAQQHIDELSRSAERARLIQGGRPNTSASWRFGLPGRLLVPRRLRIAGTETAPPIQGGCAMQHGQLAGDLAGYVAGGE